MWIKWKRKDRSDLQAQEDKNPWEILGRKWQIWLGLDCRRGIVKELLKRFEKCEEHVREKPF